MGLPEACQRLTATYSSLSLSQSQSHSLSTAMATAPAFALLLLLLQLVALLTIAQMLVPGTHTTVECRAKGGLVRGAYLSRVDELALYLGAAPS